MCHVNVDSNQKQTGMEKRMGEKRKEKTTNWKQCDERTMKTFTSRHSAIRPLNSGTQLRRAQVRFDPHPHTQPCTGSLQLHGCRLGETAAPSHVQPEPALEVVANIPAPTSPTVPPKPPLRNRTARTKVRGGHCGCGHGCIGPSKPRCSRLDDQEPPWWKG